MRASHVDSLKARVLVGAASLLSLGCASRGISHAPKDAAPGLEGLLHETEALGALFGPTHILFVAVVIAVAFALNTLIQTLVKLAWRLGFDNERRWARTSALLRLAIALLALLTLLRGALGVAPVLTRVFLLAALLGVLFLSGFVPNAFAGIALTLRRRIRIGDRVKVGEHEGVVREVGIGQLYLRAADGSTVLVPNRLLNQLPVVVERARNSVPVRVRFELEQRPDQAMLERLRQVAALSPYRAPETLVDVTRSADNERLVTVEIQVWAARAQRDARGQLEAALRRVSTGGGSGGR